jgi:hypothetical protein
MHWKWFQKAEDQEEGALIYYHDGVAERTFHTTCSAEDAAKFVRHIKWGTHGVHQSRSGESNYAASAEARSWIQQPLVDLATNRFRGLEKAQAFIKQLYDAGAEYVGIYERSHSDIEIYADSMIVIVPQRMEACRAVLAILNEEAQHGGCVVSEGNMPYHFELWWD